jgi:hypothetical protein
VCVCVREREREREREQTSKALENHGSNLDHQLIPNKIQ